MSSDRILKRLVAHSWLQISCSKQYTTAPLPLCNTLYCRHNASTARSGTSVKIKLSLLLSLFVAWNCRNFRSILQKLFTFRGLRPQTPTTPQRASCFRGTQTFTWPRGVISCPVCRCQKEANKRYLLRTDRTVSADHVWLSAAATVSWVELRGRYACSECCIQSICTQPNTSSAYNRLVAD